MTVAGADIVCAPGLHDRLRRATDPAHRAAEAAMDLDRRLSSPRAYADLLARLWGPQAGYEAALTQTGVEALGIDLSARRRSPALARDLADLDADVPPVPALPVPGGAHGALGVLYVLEGSTLGGRIILRRAHAALGPAALGATRFFTGHGASTGAMWRSFIACLARQPATGPSADRVEAAALAAFATVRSALL